MLCIAILADGFCGKKATATRSTNLTARCDWPSNSGDFFLNVPLCDECATIVDRLRAGVSRVSPYRAESVSRHEAEKARNRNAA